MVAPFTGAWIEIVYCLCTLLVGFVLVAPFTGAWIEIPVDYGAYVCHQSLPSRERGLKLLLPANVERYSRRSLHGSVD